MAGLAPSNRLDDQAQGPAVIAKVVRHGTHRSARLEDSLDRIQKLAPVMGITRVANVTGLDPVGIPVVMVSRPNSRSIAVSQGKGIDLLSARVSGLMEAAELYHAETITLSLRAATYEEVRYRSNVVDPGQLPKCAGSRFHHNLRLLWCEAYDIRTDEGWLIPYELVSTDYTIPLPDGHGCFIASSNGLASGNNLVEAISHALCEIVERDATTLWQMQDHETQNERELDLTTVDDRDCRDLLDKLEHAGLTVAIWDATSEIELPVFACLIASRSDDSMWCGSAAAGYGCHPDRRIALARAITEAAQSRLTIICGLRDDFGQEAYRAGIDPSLLNRVRNFALHSRQRRSFAAIPTWTCETIQEDLQVEQSCLSKAGFTQILVVDLSKPEFGVPVVRVIVPGLEAELAEDYTLGPRARAVLSLRK